MSHVRIYQKPKNAMQSGRYGTDTWSAVRGVVRGGTVIRAFWGLANVSS